MKEQNLNPPDYDPRDFEDFIEAQTRELMQDKFDPWCKRNLGEGIDHWMATEYDTILDYINRREFEKLGRNFFCSIHTYFENQAEEFAASQYNERLWGG